MPRVVFFGVEDFCIFRQPFSVAHIYMPILTSMTYILFTVLYYVTGGTYEDGKTPYIYKSVDWNDPVGPGRLLGLVVLIGVPLLYAVLFSVCGRMYCKARPRDGHSVDAAGAKI